MVNVSTSAISWGQQSLGVRSANGDINLETARVEEGNLLPNLNPQISASDYIYLPLEHTLVRQVTFPLKQPKFLDKDMLLEELADTASIEPDDWWLTWQVKAVDNGVAGMVFGIRKTLKDELAQNPPWQGAPLLLIDGWQRLNHWLTESHGDIAVIDADAEGVFIGVHQQGTWFGMRRLNADMTNVEVLDSVAQQVMWSLQSMGYNQESMSVVGRISPAFESLFPSSKVQKDLQIETSLSHRHELTLRLAEPTTADKKTLNIRHGSWSNKSASPLLRTWQRPLLFTTVVCFLWITLTVANNYRMESQISSLNQDIEAAFHRGLPEQPVIIDAIAQLRQAAGKNGQSSKSNVSNQLAIISQVFKETPWKMQSLNIRKSGTTLAGKVNSLDKLNTIKDKLSQGLQLDVRVADTDLKGDEVSFRISWI
ncbi:MAG: GspL/Epsl periplasmic domain-containing protein [Ghiorsea sp.]